MKRIILLLSAILCLSGCFSRQGSINTPFGSVVAVKDAGKPATFDSGTKGESIQIPEGTKMVVTKVEATPATQTTPYLPAVEKFEFTMPKATEWRRSESTTKASTGTADTTVATKRIEAEESRPLLYAALAAMVGVGIFMWLKYPTPAYICGGASVVFFLAWKLSGLPDWFYMIGIGGLVAAAAIWLGHEKGEKHNQQPKIE